MDAIDSKQLYNFGGFRLNPTHRKLLDAEGKVVALTPKTFDLLLVLIQSGGRVLTKDELMASVWFDSFVEEANLAQTISMLRKALGEVPGDNRFIVTVPGRGYRFASRVEDDVDDAFKNESLTLGNTEIPAAAAQVAEEVSKGVVGKWFVLLAIGFGILLFAALAFAYFSRNTDPRTVREVKTIAILPLRNVGGKVDEDYIGQGLSEVLITKLSNIKTIVVRPTSAVMKYAEALPDASPDVRKIGRDLDVEAVLIGRVQKVDENIRVTVQLVRVSDGATLWAETFDDKFTNMFALQDSISEQVAASLAVTLTTGERKQLAKRFTTDSEALQLYLQGRYFWNKRSTEGLQKAIDYFSQAIDKDHDFARAYSGLADSHMLLGINQYLGMNQREEIAKAKGAANRAIGLDDSLAEAHTSLGFMSYNFDFDWPTAERHFRHAIELNPNYVTAHHWYSQFLIVVRRFDESEAELKMALQLDPSSLIINADYGGMFYYSRRYDQAVAQYKKTLDLDPRFAVAHSELGRVYAEQERYDEAIAEQNRAMEISGRSPALLALLGYAYGKSGRKIEAERILRELEDLNKQKAVLPHSFVRVYIGMNEKKKAMEWMEESFKQHQAGLIVLGIEPSYDFLRDELRFQRMLAELKLTDGGERR